MVPLKSLLSTFQLGQLTKKPCLVKGGVAHKLWRLETHQGVYAIKALNLSVLQLLKGTVLPVAVSERLVREMITQGIPGVSACEGSEGVLWDNRWMVFNWIEGCNLPQKEIALDQVLLIGRLLRRIHKTTLTDIKTLPPPNWAGLPEAQWLKLIQDARDAQTGWAKTLESYLDRLIEWSQKARNAQPFLNQQLVLAHRDFDAKNVIWQKEDSFTLIDWEYVGLTYPQVDLLAVAMNWAGIIDGVIDEARFEKILEGYGESLTITDTILAGYLGYCLDWLIFNVRYGLLLREPSEKINCEIRSTLSAMELAINFIKQNYFKS